MPERNYPFKSQIVILMQNGGTKLTEDHTPSQLQQEETDVKVYFEPSQDTVFRDWMLKNPHGYYLNDQEKGNIKKQKGAVMLHGVACKHLMDSQDQITTSNGKATHLDQEVLIEWARSNGNTVNLCSTCKRRK